jgi:hypothetical protein
MAVKTDPFFPVASMIIFRTASLAFRKCLASQFTYREA